MFGMILELVGIVVTVISIIVTVISIRQTRRNKRQQKAKIKNADGGRRRTWSPALRRRIFVDGLRSMGSAGVGYPMRFADGMLRRSGPGR